MAGLIDVSSLFPSPHPLSLISINNISSSDADLKNKKQQEDMHLAHMSSGKKPVGLGRGDKGREDALSSVPKALSQERLRTHGVHSLQRHTHSWAPVSLPGSLQKRLSKRLHSLFVPWPGRSEQVMLR